MDFRAWCYEKWMEHCDEVESFGAPNPFQDSAEYFRMYKWWLKRQYIFEKSLDNPVK